MKIFKKEKEVTVLALSYLKVATDCVWACQSSLDHYLADRRAEAAEQRQQVSNLETEADSLRRQIGDKLYSGAYLPLIRGDIFRIIESLDRVPNAAEACASFFLSERPSIPGEFTDRFRELAHASFGIVEPLHDAVKSFFKPKGKVDDVRESRSKVGIRESEVDQLEWDLTVAVFDSSLDLASKQHLRNAINRIANISDRAEDATDQLELVAVKSVM